MVCYLHNRTPTVVNCKCCRKGLCGECARIFRPPMCRDCQVDSTVNASGPIVRRAIATMILAIVGFVGVDYALTLLYTTAPRFPFFSHARVWLLAHATAIDLIAGYALTAWPYGLKVTSSFGLPKGYLLPITWFYRLFEWRLIGGLFLGIFVFPFEVVGDIRTYRALRKQLRVTDRIPEYVDDQGPRRVGSSRTLRPELPYQQHQELPFANDIIDQ